MSKPGCGRKLGTNTKGVTHEKSVINRHQINNARSCVTPAAPGPPSSLILESLGETEMTLHWTAPAHTNGVLIGYLLEYQESGYLTLNSPYRFD